jgi:hypothetical protein
MGEIMSSRKLINSCYYQQVIGIPAALSHYMRTGSPPELRPEKAGAGLLLTIRASRLNLCG